MSALAIALFVSTLFAQSNPDVRQQAVPAERPKPAPEKPKDATLRALVFDSVFDVYRGVVGYVRVVSGTMEAEHAIKLMSNETRYEIKEVGVFTPKMFVQPGLSASAARSLAAASRRR